MKKWTSRFALLAVIGGLLCSALVMGCGAPEEEEAATTPTNATNTTP